MQKLSTQNHFLEFDNHYLIIILIITGGANFAPEFVKAYKVFLLAAVDTAYKNQIILLDKFKHNTPKMASTFIIEPLNLIP